MVRWGVRYLDRSTGNAMRTFSPTRAAAIAHAARLRALGHTGVEAVRMGQGGIVVVG